MEMIGRLHVEGYEALYLDAGLSPSGLNWRYQIGVTTQGDWPVPEKVIVEGSIGGGFDQVIPWCEPSDGLSMFVAKFRSRFQSQLRDAEVRNSAYVEWYDCMLRESSPGGVLVFYSDYGPDHEHALIVGATEGQLPMPPGYRRQEQ